jgi:hypothetical protein
MSKSAQSVSNHFQFVINNIVYVIRHMYSRKNVRDYGFAPGCERNLFNLFTTKEFFV